MSSTAWRTVLVNGAAIVCSVACERVNIYAVTDSPASSAPAASSDATTSSVDAGEPLGTASDVTASQPEATQSASGNAATDASAPELEPPSPGCLEPALSPGDTDVTLRVGDASRSYVLHVPEAYEGKTAAALIVDFHGIGESGRSELEASPYPALTDPEGVVMAFPDGAPGPLGSAWNFGPCCVAEVDDLAFARALVNDVATRACIDRARIYAVGVLTGGGMVQHLACKAADLFAAVAPAAFDLLEETAPDCAPVRPITVMSFRGTNDDRVPYEGGPSAVVPGMPITFLGARPSIARWAEINACAGPLSAEDQNGCASYSGCAEGTEVVLCTNYGGGNDAGDARLAWPVLSRHQL